MSTIQPDLQSIVDNFNFEGVNVAKANKVKWEVSFTLTDMLEDGEKAASKKDLLAAVKNITLPAGVSAGKFSITRVQ